MIEEWITPAMIANVGFPMALCIYLVVRMEKALNKLTEAVTLLTLKRK